MSLIDKIVENFPYPNLTPITDVSDYEILAELHTQLNCNLSSIKSNLGGGSHGLLSLTLKPSVLNTLMVTPFGIPLNPGATVNVPPSSTVAQITNLCKTYADKTKAFIQYNDADKALKQQLIKEIDDPYLKSLRKKYVCFSNQTF